MEKRIYFKNLNALRFIAATLVIFHHIEQYKLWAKLPNLCGNTAIEAMGHKAVSFFFVLSGFLITYLLLAEDKQSGEINVKNFYIRRILRIWPLYYLIVVVCLFVLPNVFDLSLLGADFYHTNFGMVSVLLLLVLPNIVRVFQPAVVGGNQLWSIGVEEQFYLAWPLLVKFAIKRIIVFLLAFIWFKFALTLVLEAWVTFQDLTILRQITRLWVLLQVEQMAIGAIGAWALFENKKPILAFIDHPATYAASIALICCLFILPVHHWWINYAEAVVFMVLIMNLSTNPAIKLNMESKALNTLGNISYGIYMYHTICITVVLFGLRSFGLELVNYTVFNVLLYTLSTLMTIVVAYYSYELFEKRFLTFKERFMVVKSGKKNPLPVVSEPIESVSETKVQAQAIMSGGKEYKTRNPSG
jgi:peptidoglycan/LPS O-acetylase OafA/YrhL